MKFNINEVIKAAIAAPAPSGLQLMATESSGTFSAGAVARACSIWAANNRAALNYSGDSAETVRAALMDIDSQIDFHKREVLRLRVELLRQTGGAEAAAAAAAAGIELTYDPALVTGQYDHERLRAALVAKRAEVAASLNGATAYEQAKTDFALVLGALLGGVQQ